MRSAVVIPVIAIDDPDHAVPLAKALVAGGIRVLEVTLRTAHGLQAIRAMAQVEGAIVGVGTLTQPEEFAAARDAGAVFGVSPGLTPALIEAAKKSGLPLLPGVHDPVRSDGRARSRLQAAEAVPGGAGGRRRHAEGDRRPAAGRDLLPDRRHLDRDRAAVPGAEERGLRGRLLADAGGRDEGRRLGPITELARSASSLRAAA
jgi:2-dehydro-3-deoxyphosphogluconate aldolase/(4S)-4-hydroxy-2-oxoglutarate aldolase